MAKGRGGRGPSRLDMRRQAEAAEAREKEDEELEGEEEEETEGEEEGEVEAEADVEEEGEEGGEDEEGGKKKKPKKKVVAKKPATKRVRAQKEVRQRALWVVFDNSQKPVEKFPYNQKAEAEALLARKIQEKEGKATFYLNLIKEPIE